MSEPIPVFMVHWNCPEKCIRAAESFLQQDYPCLVTVIDNASKPDLKKVLQDYFSSSDRVSFVWNGRNTGFAGALAPVVDDWKRCGKAPACVIAAHDVYAMPGSLSALIETLLSHPDVGLAYPSQHDPKEGLWSPVRGARLRSLANETIQSNGSILGTWFPGHCLAIKRELLERGAGFDDALFAYYEDVDLSLTARKKGFHSVLVTGALVENTEWGGSSRGSSLAPYLIARNSVLIARKHAGWVAMWFRALHVVIAGCKNWISGSGRTSSFSSKARMLGAFHALKGRFGPPPEDLNW